MRLHFHCRPFVYCMCDTISNWRALVSLNQWVSKNKSVGPGTPDSQSDCFDEKNGHLTSTVFSRSELTSRPQGARRAGTLNKFYSGRSILSTSTTGSTNVTDTSIKVP